MTRRGTGVARRYGRALLEVALAKEAGEPVRRGLATVAAALEQHRELRVVLEHPAVGAERKKAIISQVWKDEHELVRRLVGLLAERERIDLLPEIERLYRELWNARRGVVEAEALTAVPLSKEQQKALADVLRGRTGRQVELRATVAPEVLGGVVVKMEGRVYDGSVRGRLRALRAWLAGEAEGA